MKISEKKLKKMYDSVSKYNPKGMLNVIDAVLYHIENNPRHASQLGTPQEKLIKLYKKDHDLNNIIAPEIWHLWAKNVHLVGNSLVEDFYLAKYVVVQYILPLDNGVQS